MKIITKMAEGQGEDGDSWWGSWLKVAKEKSVSAFEVVKKDLAEYSCTVHHDTGQAVAHTTSSIKDKLQKENASHTTNVVRDGVTHFLESITQALTIAPDDDDEEAITITHSSKTFFDRAQAQLNDIQLDSGTYLNEPEGEKKQLYVDWLKTFDIDGVKGEISELLVNISEVRALYTKLVPATVSHADFWQRYFFKVHCLNEDENRRKALKNRAEKTVEHEDISWDDDDFESVSISSTPVRKPHSAASDSERHFETVDLSQDEVHFKEQSSSHATDNLDKGTKENVDSNKKVDDHKEEAYVVPVVVKLPSEQFTVQALPVGDTENEKSAKGESVQSDDNNGDKNMNNSSQIDHAPEAMHLSDKHVDDVASEPSESAESTESFKISPDQTSMVVEEVEVKSRVKGDTVVVGSDRSSPATSTDDGSKKESSSLDDDWERDFEVTEDDLKAVKEADALKTTDMDKDLEDDDDWENWE